jgi:hypothetical protein
MANIYTITAPATPFLQNRCMIGIFNGVGSGKVIKIYRIAALNNQTVAVTGVNAILKIVRISTGSGGLIVQCRNTVYLNHLSRTYTVEDADHTAVL